MKSLESLVEDVQRGSVRALARAITLVENGAPEALPLMKRIFPHTGRARIIGLTGAPGAGKSSLTDRLAHQFRERGHRVGVLAVDPSSPFSGGAILGDRIRMQSLALDPGIFIRSMATRGNLGGLSRATADAALLLDAAGYETVIVETVGVGQDEVDIVKTADVTLVVVVPGMGDDIQSIKAGIMEIGDVFIVNKADRDGVERTVMELEALLSLAERPDGWRPPIVRTVATESRGLADAVTAIDDYATFGRTHHGERLRRTEKIAEQKLAELVRERLMEYVRRRATHADEWKTWARQIAERESDPYSIAEAVLMRILPKDDRAES